MLKEVGTAVAAAAKLAEATDGKTPGVVSFLQDKATLGHAKRLVRISKELRRFGEAEALDEETIRLLIVDTLEKAGAGERLAIALSEGNRTKLESAEAEIERVIDLVVDSDIVLPPISDGDVVALLESGDSSNGSLEKLVEGKVENVIGELLDRTFVELGDIYAADIILDEIRSIESQSGRRAYIENCGEKDRDDFMRSLGVLVERGDVSGVIVSRDGSEIAFEGLISVKPRPLPESLNRAPVLYRYQQMKDVE